MDYPSVYGDHVSVLLAGALKAQLYVFINLREQASRLRGFFILGLGEYVGALLVGALKALLLYIY
ncbi:hypothetical protein [Pseudoalteromonas sp. SR41-7]|uniref:hypothetical protein n=1 Tax=Pseudoalteromonas sp. SR41-7 TaxID=2760947 RepID=UPI0015FF1B93|nr:hypothetical protein [Pseudoalteromonas sp. SR41-7]MBB1298277.1 hypothetical protein [Pseudoalteromonas sp. SR41-7]